MKSWVTANKIKLVFTDQPDKATYVGLAHVEDIGNAEFPKVPPSYPAAVSPKQGRNGEEARSVGTGLEPPVLTSTQL